MTQFQFSSRNEASASSDQQRKASTEARATMGGFSAHKAAEAGESSQFKQYDKRTNYDYISKGVFIHFCPLIDKKYIIRRTASITGASVGAMAGMTIGSRICPGVGTAIGGVVGGVLGAAGGRKIASRCLR